MVNFQILNKTFLGYFKESFFPQKDMKEFNCGFNKAYLYQPESHDGKMPILFMFHGTTQTALEFAQQTQMNDLAQKNGFAVCYLDKNILMNPYKAFDWIEKVDKNKDIESFAIALKKLSKYDNIDLSRVFVCGLSAGGALASIITEKLPHLIAGSAIIGGLPEGSAHDLDSALNAMKVSKKDLNLQIESPVDFPEDKELKIFILHGNKDHIVHVDNARKNYQVMTNLIDHLDDNLSNQSIKNYSTKLSNGNKIFKSVNHNRKLQVHYEEIDNMDHVWRGGDTSVAFSDIGDINNQFNLSEKIVQFFEFHKLKKQAILKPR